MARAHKIYFTWKNNNKKENQQEWQLQDKILNETNSFSTTTEYFETER